MVSVIPLVKGLLLKKSLENPFDAESYGSCSICIYTSGRGHLTLIANAMQYETRTDLTGDASSMLYSTMSAGEDTRAGATECERKNV